MTAGKTVSLVDVVKEIHLALEGDGMFAAESPEGEVYTRYGAFTIDDNGTLVTEDGYPLAWEERLIAFDPMGPPPTVDTDGQVNDDDRDPIVVEGEIVVVRNDSDIAGLTAASSACEPARK